MKEFVYYLSPHREDSKYLKIDESTEIPFWNIFSKDGKSVGLHNPSNDPDKIQDYDFIAIGRILEIHRQVKAGLRTYDPYVLSYLI